MCGRFTQKYTWRGLVDLYRLTQPARNLEPRHNVAPTTEIDVLRVRNGAREIVSMRWGLVPGWWKKSLKEMPATFNARSDTVAEKPMYRNAFKRSRCIIPASGYYEWRAEGGVLSIGGLWDEWREGNSPLRLLSCTMIVTEANEFAGHVHERMPVFLAEDSFGHGSTAPPAPSFCVPLLNICCICGQYQGASIAPPTASMIRRFLTASTPVDLSDTLRPGLVSSHFVNIVSEIKRFK